MYLPNQPTSRHLWKCRLLWWGPNLTFTSVPPPTRTVYMLPCNFRHRTVFACSLFIIHEVIYLHHQVPYCQSAPPKDRGYVAHAGERAVRRVLAGSTVCRRISCNVRWPYCTALNWKQHKCQLFGAMLSICDALQAIGHGSLIFWACGVDTWRQEFSGPYSSIMPYRTHSFVLACHGLKLTWHARWSASHIRWILFLNPCREESIESV